MLRHFTSLIAVGCLLSNCATTPPPVCQSIGWSEYGRALAKPVRHTRHVANQAPAKPDPSIESDKALANLRPYSSAWWAMREQIDAEEQRHLNAKLVICRGCLPTTEDLGDLTGSADPPTRK